MSCANLNLEPVGEDDYTNDDYQAQVQFRITFPSAHNPAEDWSSQGIPSTVGASPVTVSDMTLYSGNTRVWGTPPVSASGPSAPGSLTAGSITSTGATLAWTASSAGTNPVVGYDVYTSAGTLVGTTTSTLFTVTGLNADRTAPYGYYVTAVGSQGYASPASNIAQFITSPDTSLTASDMVPPSEPGTPLVSSVSSTGAKLSWGASIAGTSKLTGYRVYELAPSTGLVATTTSPSYTLSGLTGSTAYAYVVEAIDSQDRTSQFATPATFYTGAPATTSSPSPSPSPSPSGSTSAGVLSCSAVYSLVNSWSGGFQAQVTLTNTGTGTINPWTLIWTFPGNQQISDLWNATYTQSGEHVTVTPESYDASIAPSGSVTIGFTGTFTNSDASPTSFSVNGTACTT